MFMCLRFIAAVSLVTLLLSPSNAMGQASLQVPLQFDFLNPGARSLALGGAFTGLADDATSGFTNPAGLVILQFPEVSFEGRFRHLESRFLSGGRLSGTPTNRGIDTVNGAVYGTADDDSAGPSFISVVVPVGKWAVAGYRHEFVRLEQSFRANGVFQGPDFRELALLADRSVDITAYGGSVAVRPTPRVSLGGSIVYYTFGLESDFRRFRQTAATFFDAPTFAPNLLESRTTQSGDDSGIGFNVGGLFTLKERPTGGGSGADLVLGVVYRKAPGFEFSGAGEPERPDFNDGRFRPPTAFAVGVASHLTANATVSFDVAHVRYRSLIDGYITKITAGTGKTSNFAIDAATEIHGGFEYVFPVTGSPAIRVGAWLDPGHAITYTPPVNRDLLDDRFAAYLPGADDLTHFTFGGGFAFNRQFEVNGGADISKRTRIISVSAVVRFAR